MADPVARSRRVDPSSVRMLVFDVDGVLTDGRLYYADDGGVGRAFDIKDGMAIRLAREAGLVTAVLTAKVSGATRRRMADLKIDHVLEGRDAVGGKGAGIEELAALAGVSLAETAYMGDDLMDLPAMSRAGYAMCPADAVAEVRAVADFVSPAPGGRGAVRGAVEHVMQAQGTWAESVRRYAGGAV